MNLLQFSLVPKNYKNKDPRTLPFLYPQSINIVSYAKQVQEFYYYQMLELAEDMAKKQGFILLPWSCIHWQRAKNFGSDRKVKIGRKSFFLMRLNELTSSEKRKLENYLQGLRVQEEKVK